jgi:adenylate cyclase
MSSVAGLRYTANPLMPLPGPTDDTDDRGRDLALDVESCSAEQVRAELHRVVESSQFDSSERNRRFLAYVVEEALAGRSDRIKAYSIATAVFGRDANFDPQTDPVVRMEARRLRRSLERFYLTDGSSSVRIDLPKGRYVPLFRSALSRKSALEDFGRTNDTGELALRELGSSILVTEFEAEGEQSPFLNFSSGFARQLIVTLSRFPELFVFGPEAILPRAIAPDNRTLPPPPDMEFILTGSTAISGDVLNAKVMLVHPRTGRVLWGHVFDRNIRTSGVLNARDEIANSVVRTLAEPFGVIFNSRAKDAESTFLRALSPLDYLIRFYQYRRECRQDLFPVIRECLERGVMAYPDYAEVVSCLSLLYSDAHLFGIAPGESAARLRQQATAFAYKAIELAPNSSRAYHALGRAHWFMQDSDASINALEHAFALNPNATEVMADLGSHLVLSGDWDRGVPLLEEAFARNPALPGTNRIGLSLHHFANERFCQALAEAAQIRTPHLAHGLVAQAIALVRLGRRDEAAALARRIPDVAPTYSRTGMLADLTGPCANRRLAHLVAAALEDAGLPDGPGRVN